jgi:hypothetical protein
MQRCVSVGPATWRLRQVDLLSLSEHRVQAQPAEHSETLPQKIK